MDIGEIERRLDVMLEACGRNVQGDPEIEAVEESKKSLRLVPRLIAVVEAARETLDSFVRNGCYDASTESEECCKELRRALAALDAGEGVK